MRRVLAVVILVAIASVGLPASAVPTRVADAPTPGTPSAVAFDPVTRLAYVAVANAGMVVVYAGAGSGVPDESAATTTLLPGQAGAFIEIGRVKVGPQPSSVATDGRFAYVTNFGDGTITILSGLRVVGSIGTGSDSGPVAVAADPVNMRICVALWWYNEIQIFDTRTNTPAFLSRVVFSPGARPIALAADRAHCYGANHGDGTVRVIDLAGTPAEAVPNGIAVPGGANALSAIAADPLTGLVWVANSGDDSVSIVDPLRPAKAVEKIQLAPSSDPTGIAASGSVVYVTENAFSRVALINPVTKGLGIVRRPTGGGPNAVAVAATPAVSGVASLPGCAAITNGVSESVSFYCDVL